MIKIRIIEIRKCYKWICVLLTGIMCIVACRVLIFDLYHTSVKANTTQQEQKVVQAEKQQDTKDSWMKLFFCKTIPAMEISYKKKGDFDSSTIAKNFLSKVVNFDYEDPKTLFKAQISMLDEMDDDLAEKHGYKYKNDNLQENLYNKEELTKEYEDVKDQEEISVSKNIEIEDLSKEVKKDKIIESKESKEPIQDNPKEDESKKLDTIKVISSKVKKPNKVKLNLKKPSIFIYHTHATESYMPEAIGNFHSLNRKYTVRAVGDVLADHLGKMGYNVIHDNTIHDYPSYQKAYVRSLETLRKNLKNNSSLKIVFDVHRDAAPNNSKEVRERSYVTINNEKVAKFSIVVGTGNENAEKLLVLAEYIKAKSDKYYPGLAKKTITKPYKFNGYNSDYYVLLEVGNNANYIDESLRTAKYVAKIVDEVIKDIKE
ncbi:stage II sporulation protein P [Lutibacter sp. B2]|nr:stage II sporulation protein P [Lutibacter sp. B2]